LAASYLANVEDLCRPCAMLEAGTGQSEQATEPAQSKVTDHAKPAHTEQAQPPMNTPEQTTQDTTKDGPIQARPGLASLTVAPLRNSYSKFVSAYHIDAGDTRLLSG
jgi:hypothetical protein